MELDWIKYFVTIAETGVMRKSAERLFISESTLSKSMKKLEKELGITLFEPKGRGVVLTKAGEKYYEKVRTILNEFYDLNHSIQKETEVTAKETIIMASYANP